jgi:hypothetical protein
MAGAVTIFAPGWRHSKRRRRYFDNRRSEKRRRERNAYFGRSSTQQYADEYALAVEDHNQHEREMR